MNENEIKVIIDNILKTGKLSFIDLEKCLAGLSESDTDKVLQSIFEKGFILEEYTADKLSDSLIDDNVKIYLNQIGNIPVLSQAEEQLLFKKYSEQHSIAIRNKLVEYNLKLVVSIAKHYMDFGMPLEDLIQNGNLGLIKAIDRFDYTKNYKFSTYAVYWINQAIIRGIANENRLMRLPVHVHTAISKVKRTYKKLEQQFGREPSIIELVNKLDMPEKKVIKLLSLMQSAISIDTPINDESPDITIADNLTADIDIENDAMNSELRSILDDVIWTLSPREIMVLQLRYGLKDGVPHTLEEVGQKFGVTRERIRQVEAKALRKLRSARRRMLLEDYYV